jgi:hypothetical protein
MRNFIFIVGPVLAAVALTVGSSCSLLPLKNVKSPTLPPEPQVVKQRTSKILGNYSLIGVQREIILQWRYPTNFSFNTYILESTTNFITWKPELTNTTSFDIWWTNRGEPMKFFRVHGKD